MNISTNLDDVAIAISSFKSTESISDLLEEIFSSNISFAEVIIVDSISDGSLEELIKANNYDVNFYNATTNIGSAGNLNKRLEIASNNSNIEWCFCINHDGYFNAESIITLVDSAKSIKNKGVDVGAVFPSRIRYNKKEKKMVSSDNVYEEILWSSSNGSLYSVKPYRENCKVDDNLWMGWEDLLYCLKLKEKGYTCFLSNNSFYYDSYEYEKVKILFFDIYIADKPSWYNYYSTRNLVLGLKSLDDKDYLYKKLLVTVLKSAILTIAFKKDKTERLSLSFQGLIDGIQNKTGYKDRSK